MYTLGGQTCNLRCCKGSGQASTNDKLIKLYDAGTEKLREELGAVQILRDLRKLKIYNKQLELDHATKFKIQHDEMNLIDIDSDCDDIQNVYGANDSSLNNSPILPRRDR